MSLGEVIEAINGLPNREYKLCVEMLNARGDKGSFLRRKVNAPSAVSTLSASASFQQWLAENRIHSVIKGRTVLLLDSDLMGVKDNPMDVTINGGQLEGPSRNVLHEAAGKSAIGLMLSGNSDRLLSDTISIKRTASMTFRDLLLVFSNIHGVEWQAEVIPPSLAEVGQLTSDIKNGFVSCRVAGRQMSEPVDGKRH